MQQVVIGIAGNKTVKEIALDLHVSPKTVEYHWAMAKVKHNLNSPVSATLFALRRGWVNQFGEPVNGKKLVKRGRTSYDNERTTKS